MFLGHELIIASPKSFAVCFLFKYSISHQQESLTISCPCLISASGNKGMLKRLGADPSGEMIGRGGLMLTWGHKGESPAPHPLWTSWSWSLRSCIVLLLLDDLFASLLRISSQSIYGDFTASQTESSCCSSAWDPSHMSYPCL